MQQVGLVDRASRDFSETIRCALEYDRGNRLFHLVAGAATLALSGCSAPELQEDSTASFSGMLVLALCLAFLVAALRPLGRAVLLAIGSARCSARVVPRAAAKLQLFKPRSKLHAAERRGGLGAFSTALSRPLCDICVVNTEDCESGGQLPLRPWPLGSGAVEAKLRHLH